MSSIKIVLLNSKKKIAQWENERDRIRKRKKRTLFEREAADMISRREKLAKKNLEMKKIAKAKEEKRVLELRIMNELEDDLIQTIRQKSLGLDGF